ncbi:MAG: methyltransferase domain-containing protein [Deltaproteobacteria bacterium]|nr:methyltransferase domain-containing protein [Deltaproteobacteria bacterium]
MGPLNDTFASKEVADLVRYAAALYAPYAPVVRALATCRPYICPFDRLLPLVPFGATVLDVGCGQGLFLGLLAATGRVQRGFGTDIDDQKLDTARAMASRHRFSLAFRHEHACPTIDERETSIVTAIDVVHHVPRASQRAFVAGLCQRVADGGRLLIKEMAPEPTWMAHMNRLHDLVLARTWIAHVSLPMLCAWIEDEGLDVVETGTAQRLWYSHIWVLARRRKQ